MERRFRHVTDPKNQKYDSTFLVATTLDPFYAGLLPSSKTEEGTDALEQKLIGSCYELGVNANEGSDVVEEFSMSSEPGAAPEIDDDFANLLEEEEVSAISLKGSDSLPKSSRIEQGFLSRKKEFDWSCLAAIRGYVEMQSTIHSNNIIHIQNIASP